MSVYSLSHEEYLMIRDDEVYFFLADTAKEDHGEHMTLTMSDRAMPMLIARLGLKTVVYHDKLDHHKRSYTTVVDSNGERIETVYEGKAAPKCQTVSATPSRTKRSRASSKSKAAATRT